MIAVEAVEAAVAEIAIMSNDGSMSLTPRNTTPHSPRQIHRRWELKDERAYSGGKIRLDVAAEVAGEVAGEVVTTTGKTITIKTRTAMTIGMVMMASAVDMAMAANVKSSRLAVTIRIKEMIPQMIEP